MASPAFTPATSVLHIGSFDGQRQPVPQDFEVLVTLRNGMQEELFRDYRKASELHFALPFYDNLADNFAVIAFAKGHEQAGFYPVRLSAKSPQYLDLMLLPKDSAFHFAGARWEDLPARHPGMARLLAAGAAPDAARDRYTDLMEDHPATLACFFNIGTALQQTHLPAGGPLDYCKELIWDRLAQDRFFAWADVRLVEQVRRAAEQHLFSPEPDPGTFHPGATSSFKQIQFGEANLQLTFHEGETRTIDGTPCVVVEPDIDYYKDLGAHALLEVIPNTFTGTLTDPRQVYVLRWMAGRRAGIPEFDPPYTIA